MIFALFAVLVETLLASPIPTPTVQTDHTKRSEIFDTLSFPARITPKVNASVLSETDGILEKALTPIGTQVKKNQTLFIIKNTDPVYDYAPVRTRSPVKGIVSSLEVTEGSRVTKGQKLAAVTDPDQIKITIEVTPQDQRALSEGFLGKLTIASIANAIPVKITGISPFVDPATGTATVEMQFADKPQNLSLSPGMLGRASFETQKHNGIQIPDVAIQYRGAGTFVAIVEGGKTKFVPVKLGPMRQGIVEVLEGLKENVDYVVRSSAFLSDGQPVAVQKGESR